MIDPTRNLGAPTPPITAPKQKGISATTAIITLLVLCFILFFYQLGSYPFFDVDEPRYAETAREMLEANEWITPTFNYELRLNKPVFYYWMIVGAYKLFGVSEFSARLTSASMASLMVFLTFFFGRVAISNRFGLISAIILATSIEMIGLGRMSITDMALSSLITGCIISLAMVAFRSPKWWIMAGIFSGLAILTKGPVGIVLPGAILLIYSLFSGQFKTCFINRWFAVALLIALLLPFPWYFSAYQVHGQFFLDELYHNNLSRFNGQISYHIQPWYYYTPVLLIGFIPWSIFLPASIAHTAKTLITQAKDFGNHALQREKASRHTSTLKGKKPNINLTLPLTLYASIWAVFIFAFFSVAQTKLPTYILPMFPAVALLTGLTWEHIIENHCAKTKSAWANGLSTSLIASSGLLALALTIASPLLLTQTALFLPKNAKHVTGIIENPLSIVAVASLALGTLFMTLFLIKKKPFQAIVAQGLGLALVVGTAVHSILPMVNGLTQDAMVSFAEKTKGRPVVSYEITRPSLTYYTQQKIEHVAREDYDKLATALEQAHQTSREGVLYIITKNSLLSDLQHQTPKASELTVVERHPVYSLLKLQKGLPSPSNETE